MAFVQRNDQYVLTYKLGNSDKLIGCDVVSNFGQ